MIRCNTACKIFQLQMLEFPFLSYFLSKRIMISWWNFVKLWGPCIYMSPKAMQYLFLYNLYKESCPLIGWIVFIILTIRWQNPITLRLGRQECKKYLLLYSSFTFILECSLFPIQYSDVCSKTRLIRKTTCESSRNKKKLPYENAITCCW